jgi:hypothetical protein
MVCPVGQEGIEAVVVVVVVVVVVDDDDTEDDVGANDTAPQTVKSVIPVPSGPPTS